MYDLSDLLDKHIYFLILTRRSIAPSSPYSTHNRKAAYKIAPYGIEINKLKTEKSKSKLEKRKTETLRELSQYTALLTNVINFQNSMVEAKMVIVNKLNRVKQLMDTFVRTSKGFKVTNPEGYVAIDRVSGNAVKLVDRMEFSYNNFTAIKAWDR